MSYRSIRSGRRNSTIEDLLDLASRLPWWADLLLIAVSYIGLHIWHIHLAEDIRHFTQTTAVPNRNNPLNGITLAVHTSLHRAPIYIGAIFTEVFQYLFPVIFLIGGIVSLFGSLVGAKLDKDDMQNQ